MTMLATITVGVPGADPNVSARAEGVAVRSLSYVGRPAAHMGLRIANAPPAAAADEIGRRHIRH